MRRRRWGVGRPARLTHRQAVIDPQKHPKRHQTILVVFVVAGAQLGNALVAPEVRAWEAQRVLNRFLKDDPFFSAVLADHPELRGPIEIAVLQGLKDGSREDAEESARAVLAPIIPQYLSRASNDAVLGFTQAMVPTLAALQSDNPNRCYQYLNPGVGGSTIPTVSEGRSELMSWMVRAVESAQQNPQPTEGGDDVMVALEGVQESLIERYGDLSPLADPSAPDADRTLVCGMTIALYKDILTLPREDVGPLLRYLYAP